LPAASFSASRAYGLDGVLIPSAHAGERRFFDFDYRWEVYKPEHQRKFGYYALPILWGDRLVARFDSRFDRTTNTFVVLGFWLEDERLGKNERFAKALAGGFLHFAKFLGASTLGAKALSEPLLRQCVNSRRTELAADA
jgi:uncharacterized protein YcaQ